jgi:hypothetical protein
MSVADREISHRRIEHAIGTVVSLAAAAFGFWIRIEPPVQIKGDVM